MNIYIPVISNIFIFFPDNLHVLEKVMLGMTSKVPVNSYFLVISKLRGGLKANYGKIIPKIKTVEDIDVKIT